MAKDKPDIDTTKLEERMEDRWDDAVSRGIKEGLRQLDEQEAAEESEDAND